VTEPPSWEHKGDGIWTLPVDGGTVLYTTKSTPEERARFAEEWAQGTKPKPDICEIPHQTIADEDACEQQRLMAAPDTQVHTHSFAEQQASALRDRLDAHHRALQRVLWVVAHHPYQVAAQPSLVLRALDADPQAVGWCPDGCTGDCEPDPAVNARHHALNPTTDGNQ
jgi:hypothetical protein